MDILNDLFIPVANLFRNLLNTTISFGGVSIKLFYFILFAFLCGIFVRVISIIGGIHFDL